MDRLDQSPLLTEQQVQTFATNMATSTEWKEIIRRMKADTIKEWANAADVDAREKAHADLMAIDRLEKKLQTLKEDDTVRRRHEEFERAKQERAAKKAPTPWG